MNENKSEIDDIQAHDKGMVHLILSHSYAVFFLMVILGVTVDIFVPIAIFNTRTYQYAGFTMILLGSWLIYWAQSTSRTPKEDFNKPRTEKDFEKGPYKYSRNPTHIGLTVMTLGFALLINSLFSVIFLVIASLITKFIFLREEEAFLEKKYGQVYTDYKKKVSTWV
jgi:protein-S-isoprenylcysteine O-methyltransferase Ste14